MSQVETIVVKLGGSVGVAEIAELHGKLIQASEASQPVTFDFSDTRSVDASVVQLLLASGAAMKNEVVRVSVRGVSEPLAKSLESYGAGEVLSLRVDSAHDESVATETAA